MPDQIGAPPVLPSPLLVSLEGRTSRLCFFILVPEVSEEMIFVLEGKDSDKRRLILYR